jgi:hypothetical protein
MGHGDGFKTVCALIMAGDEASAQEVIRESYDEPPTEIVFRFIETRDVEFVRQLLGQPGAPLYVDFTDMDGIRSTKFIQTSRFSRATWMPDILDPEFDPLEWSRKQSEAADASKIRYRDVLERNETDREILASDMPDLVLRSKALSLAADLIGDAISKARNTEISTTEILEDCMEMLEEQLDRHSGYVMMAERELTEFKLGTYILADSSSNEVYLKTKAGSVALDGNIDSVPNLGNTRIIPVRLVGTPAQ